MNRPGNDIPRNTRGWTGDIKADAAYAQENPRWKLTPEEEAAALELAKRFEDQEVYNAQLQLPF